MSDTSNGMGSLGLLFVAAGLYTSLQSNKAQASIERANIKMQTSQAQLQAAEAGLARVKNFRESTSMNLALSSMGFGGTMGGVAAQNQSFANFSSDMAALEKQKSFTALSGESSLTQSKLNKYTRDLGAYGNAAKQTSDLASKLGLFAGG